MGATLAQNFVHSTNYRNFLTRCDSQFVIAPATPSEIKDTVLNMRNSCPGYDNLPTRLFKDNIDSLADIITHLCNKSFAEGIFPERLKVARVTCVYKAGDRSEFKNYRPISVLCCFDKILEKLITNRIVNYFDSNNLFTHSQFGFRKQLSTSDAVQQMVSYLYDAFDEGETAVGVFLDLARAFDGIHRGILLDKLDFYGVTGTSLSWFHSFLSSRRQYVRLSLIHI